MSYDKSRKLKSIVSDKRQLEIRRESLLEQMDLVKEQLLESQSNVRTRVLQVQKEELGNTLESIQSELNELNDEIQKIGVVVSEHAILKFISETNRLDIDEIINAMIPPKVKKIIAKLGNGEMKHNGMIIVFRNNTVVTTYKDER